MTDDPTCALREALLSLPAPMWGAWDWTISTYDAFCGAAMLDYWGSRWALWVWWS